MFAGDGVRMGEASGYKEFTNPDDINVRVNVPSVPITIGGSSYGFPSTGASGAGQPPDQPSQQQQQQQQQPQILILQAPRMKRSYEKYNSRAAVVCGALQVGAGFSSVVLGIANAPTCALLGVLGYGIWCGALFLLSGFFGIVTSRRRTTCTIISHMVLSIISANAAAVQFALGVTSATYDLYNFSPPTTGCYYSVGPYSYGDPVGPEGATATDSLLAICAIVEAVAAIVGSAISCKVVCCSSHFQPATQGQVSFHLTHLPAASAGGVMHPTGQVVYNINNPGVISGGAVVMPPQYSFPNQQQPQIGYANVSSY